MKNVGPCIACRTDVWLPESLYHAAKHSQAITFYCAYGHPQVFVQGDSEATKLRRERDRLAQQIAYKDDEISHQRKTIISMKGQATKLKKRVKAGVCPCCTRSFSIT